MELTQCKACANFLSMMGESVLCSHDNDITERNLKQGEDNMYVTGCPLEDDTSFAARTLRNEPLSCEACQGKGRTLHNNKEEPCPLCDGEGSLTEDMGTDEEVMVPHLAEFRVKAVRMGDKYKVVMTTRKNANLVSSCRLIDADDPLFNSVFFACKNMLQQEEE